MKITPSASNKAGFNLAELLARVENDRELLRELLSIFKQEFPTHFQDLREAVARQDAAGVAAASHALKGMLANLAIAGAAKGAAHLEKVARSGEIDSLKPAFATLEEQVRGLLQEMDTYMGETRS